MPIPDNITKSHLLQAIEKIDKEGIPNDGDSQYYNVLYDGKNYPPKLIVAYANLFANGEILNRASFSGGLNTQCFKLLEENEFKIIAKPLNNNMTYFSELSKFIIQADTGTLGTANYLSNYLGLRVSVSFGKGNPARIPWIAFLIPGQTVQDGIYPVYLYYKIEKLLILTYGLSETKKPTANWDLNNPQTITSYFLENKLGQPLRYGNSFVFKVYDLNQSLNEAETMQDLNAIIEFYKNTFNNKPMKVKDKADYMGFDYNYFNIHAQEANLFLTQKTTLRFIASLLTKPFVILTGLSGSGKTKLAQAFASWICKNENQYCIVPVGADWTNREPLLGFPNALKDNDYVKPDNKVLDLIINANTNTEIPYFLILDEMNLSHVERYFADFLSVMESKSTISIHSGNEKWNDVPPEIGFPKNLFIIGTVNIDETTYMFSPKVLDRSNVIEFRVTADEMVSYLNTKATLNLETLAEMGANMGTSFVEFAKDDSLESANTKDLKRALMDFFTELKKTGAEFGYRSASEILRFAAVINTIEPIWSMHEIIDAAIMQKLLPKVHGSRRKLEPVLKVLGALCLQEDQKFDDLLIARTEIDFTDISKIKYPISLEKILRMYDNLISNGFTSYAEA